MSEPFDAIVVGARCAGSPTAMLLARKGYRVLLVDRATFPSDTVSTHLIHPPGVAALESWGLLERVLATGCPPVDTYAFDFGPFTISGAPGNSRGTRRLRAAAHGPGQAARGRGRPKRGPRSARNSPSRASWSRTAGWSAFAATPEEARRSTEHARVVIGADGRYSLVADARGRRRVQREAHSWR